MRVRLRERRQISISKGVVRAFKKLDGSANLGGMKAQGLEIRSTGKSEAHGKSEALEIRSPRIKGRKLDLGV
jgi:hypothetical protein